VVDGIGLPGVDRNILRCMVWIPAIWRKRDVAGEKRRFTMSDEASEAVASAIREVVDANRILFDQGVVDGFGHVSSRHPVRPDHFLKHGARACHRTGRPCVRSRRRPIEADGPAACLERFIHSEI
jgi:hypothetical protein